MVRCYLLATNSLFDRYWIATLDLASKGPRLPPRFRVALNGSPGDPPARPRPPGQLVRFFVSETGCARALLGWSQNTLVYAAGLGRVKDAQGGFNVDELDAGRQRSSRQVTRSYETSSVNAWLRKPILRHAQLTDLDGACECIIDSRFEAEHLQGTRLEAVPK